MSTTLYKGLRIVLLLTILLVNLELDNVPTVHAAPPSHDNFASAKLIDSITYTDFNVNTTEATFQTLGAGNGADPDNVGPCENNIFLNRGKNTVWYTYTPSVTESITAETTNSNYDTYLAVWTGTADNLNLVGCNDENFDGYSELSFIANPGTTYYIQVAQFNGYFGEDENPPVGGLLQFRVTITNTAVTIGNSLMGTYYVPAGGSERVDYDVNNGPVKIANQVGDSMVAALLDAWQVNGVTTSYAQIMGLPDDQLSTTYYFPAYNNRTLYNQLRFANLGNASTNVTVIIGGISRGTYSLAPNQERRVDYDLNTGPVVVTSTSQPIIAALLDAWRPQGTTTTTSYTETMGLPVEQLSTTYYFPAYNNRTLYGQLRFANVGASSTDVTVTIGGIVRGTYTLAPSTEKRVEYNLNTGPVVISSDGQPIIAALLDAWRVGGVTTSYSQLMGLPLERLSTAYYFPAYNNRTLYNQVRFGNVGNATTNVTVTIGGIDRGTYMLAPNQQERVDYDLNTGPVVISSDGQPIIAALLDAWQLKSPLSIPKTAGGFLQLPAGTTTSYVQLMGLPVAQLADIYYFPAYNNRTLYAQLRFGVP